jgi:hypothetical protein
VDEQVPLWQVAIALAVVPEHALEQEPQWFGSLDVSTHVPLHEVGELEGHAATHAKVPPMAAQTGVAPAHALPQAPHVDGVEGSAQPASPHCIRGAAQTANPASASSARLTRPASPSSP